MSTGELQPEIRQHLASGKRYAARLEQQEVRRTVIVDVRVISAIDIGDFTWQRQHADYGGAAFELVPAGAARRTPPSASTSPELRALGARPDLQISTIVLPALVETIHHLRDVRLDPSADDHDDKLWARAMTALVERHGGFDESTLTVAQAILSDPVDRTLARAVDMSEAEDDE